MMTGSRRQFLAFGAAATLAPWVRKAQAYSCSGQGTPISVGGVTGLDSLADPAHSRTLRQSCRTALYIHEYIWARTKEDLHKAILATFAGAPVDAEFNLMNNPETWFAQPYKKLFTDVGIQVRYSHVNGFAENRLDDWQHFVSAARRRGIETVAPIFSPNSRQYASAPFSSPKWNYLREGEKAGGAVTTDSPPHYFLAQPEAYRQFVVENLKWGNAAGLHTTFIISPNASGIRFLEETRQAVAYLSKHDALPKAWVVENYNPNALPTYPNTIGTESDSQNVLGVALWLARNTA
ncbi:MAG TPA: hypothetical protein VGC69_07370 [Bordetella sp.]